jgi:mRNA interferase MazF
MKRGEIWTVAGSKDYAGKPRPVVIVQEDSFDATDSIALCAFTTDQTEAPLLRLLVEPNERNGLRAACRLMVDKITTVPKSKIGARVGRLDDADILRLNQAILVFLGLAMSSRTKELFRRAAPLPGAHRAANERSVQNGPSVARRLLTRESPPPR